MKGILKRMNRVIMTIKVVRVNHKVALLLLLAVVRRSQTIEYQMSAEIDFIIINF